MQPTLFNNLIRPNRFYRVIAIFFLVFTAIDLTCPSFCREEGPAGESQAVAQTADPEINSEDRLISSDETDGSCPKQPAHPSEIEEDCFCCCSHIIPGCHPSIAVLNESPHVDIPSISSLPSAPPRDTFHPPRLS